MKLSNRSVRLIEPSFRGKRPLKYLLLILLAGIAVYYQDSKQKETPVPATEAVEQQDSTANVNQFPSRESGKLERAVDGDTLIVQTGTGRWRVRLIGCDTPETVKKNTPVQPFGPEASEYTKKRIAEFDGRLTLVADGDLLDRYGRRLAMVYLGDGTDYLLNEELIQNGLARAMVKYRYSAAMKTRFTEAENQAKCENLGIWSLDDDEK